MPSSVKNTRGQIIIRCLIGSLVLAAIFLLYSAYHQSRKPAIPPSVVADATAVQASKPSSVQFDFYTALPKMAVTTETAFWLQVGAFRQRSEASHFADEMRNLGYHATIQKYSDGPDGVGYRVMLGPYTSTEAVTRDQTQLDQRHIRSILIKTR